MNAAPNIIALPAPESSFNAFWEVFPRRVAKLAAQRAWLKAVKLASPDEIIAGVERYKRHKPDYADWCHPATFLSSGRWMDEYNDHVAVSPISRQQCPSRSDVIDYAKKQGDSQGFVVSWYERKLATNFASPEGLTWREMFLKEFNNWRLRKEL